MVLVPCPFRSIAGGSRTSWGRAWGWFQARRALRWLKTGCRIRGQQQQKAGKGQVTSHYQHPIAMDAGLLLSGRPATPPPPAHHQPAHHHETSSVLSRVQPVKGEPRRTRPSCSPSCGPAFLLPTGCSLTHGVPLQRRVDWRARYGWRQHLGLAHPMANRVASWCHATHAWHFCHSSGNAAPPHAGLQLFRRRRQQTVGPLPSCCWHVRSSAKGRSHAWTACAGPLANCDPSHRSNSLLLV
jgi:hypothetical protein